MYLTFLSCADLAIKGVQSFMKDNSLTSADEIAEVVVNQQMASALKSTNKTNIFLRAVITPDYFKNKEIQANSETVKKITPGKQQRENKWTVHIPVVVLQAQVPSTCSEEILISLCNPECADM